MKLENLQCKQLENSRSSGVYDGKKLTNGHTDSALHNSIYWENNCLDMRKLYGI